MKRFEGNEYIIMQKIAEFLDSEHANLSEDLKSLRVKKTDWEIGDDIYFIVSTDKYPKKAHSIKWFPVKEYFVADKLYATTHLGIKKDSVNFIIETEEGRHPAYINHDGYQIARSRGFDLSSGYVDSGAFPTYEQAFQFISRIAHVD